MKKGCMKKQGSTSDFISHLPSYVIQNILMRMPLQDAVKTSVLSRKWRYAWMTLPQLVFDYVFYEKLRRPPQDRLMRAIYQVLLLHRGPIAKFQFSLPVLKICPEIDQLILFVSNNDIQEFILRIPVGEPYKLPSSIFACVQLKRLVLRLCLFNPPPRFEVFSRLHSLVLQDIVIAPEVFSSLISNCPVLKKLDLQNFISFNFKYLEISAPSLTSFKFHGEFNSICFKNTPKLARVSIHLVWELLPWEPYEGGPICDWVTFFAALPVIESLELNHECLKMIFAGDIPKRLPTNLSHLKTLKLNLVYLHEISSILCFLRSSPNLEEVTIGLPTALSNCEETVNCFEVEGWSDITLNKLQKVELLDAYSTRLELELIKLILAKSPVLEKMVIEQTDLIDFDGLKFLTEVTRFRRVSPLAEVCYEIP